jgi:hypothetical protein
MASFIKNPNITMKDILDNPDKPWNWEIVSSNYNITMEFVNNNPHKPWDWNILSRHPNISFQDVVDNPDKPWDWNWLSWNNSLTLKYIDDNPDKPWNWNGISFNRFGLNISKLIEYNKISKLNKLLHIFLNNRTQNVYLKMELIEPITKRLSSREILFL